MSLQDTFYIVGIVCMTLYTLLLIGILGVMIYIKQKISEVHQQLENKLADIKEVVDRARESPIVSGISTVANIIDKASKFFSSRKKQT